MQIAVFLVPLATSAPDVDDLNRFLRSHRVLTVDRHFVEAPHGPAWAFCVEYLEMGHEPADGARRAKRIDYREVLPEAEFAVFSRLRALRKEIAERDGVPAYLVFTNEQLSAMVTGHMVSGADLRAIAGVGDERVAKYGERFLAILAGAFGQP